MSNANTPKKKILIIEDNPGILYAMNESLSLDGYELETSPTFLGTPSVHESKPDLIFMDIFLKSQDGREVTRELKADARTRHIPVILLSAYPGIKELAAEAGADGYLAKPFHLEDLLLLAKKYTA